MELLLNLFGNFLQVGLFSFGGGYATIPLIQQYIVDTQQWLTLQELTDILTISQMTPGPIAVNTSTFVGTRVAGFPGAVVATIGCVISGVLLSTLLYFLFRKYRDIDGVTDVLSGLRASSVGLIAASACTILLIALTGTAQPTALTIDISTAALFAASLFLLRKFKTNPLLVMLLSGAAGVVLYVVFGIA